MGNAAMTSKALMIEDNDQNRYLLRFILEQHDFVVVEATTGMEGLELARSESPDFILLDIQLPGMDGVEVARRLRQEQIIAASVPIIAVTSFAMAGDRERFLEAGCDGYIEKPIDPDTIISEIRAIIGGGDLASD